MLLGLSVRRFAWAVFVCLLAVSTLLLAVQAKTCQYHSHAGIEKDFSKSTKMSDDRVQTYACIIPSLAGPNQPVLSEVAIIMQPAPRRAPLVPFLAAFHFRPPPFSF